MSKKLLWLSCVGVAVVIALASVIVGTGKLAVRASGTEATNIQKQFDPMCNPHPAFGQASCLAVKVTYKNMTTGKTVNIEPANVAPDAAAPAGYGPSQLQSAYNLVQASANNGAGQTIAIVDAQDDPNAEADLATYRSQFGLPACTTANGCFKKLDENGGTNYPTADPNWGVEISLDLDMASAICPNCNIMLVEANSASFQDLATAEDTAAAQGANVISNSYGGQEDTTFAADYNHPGTIITASSGDNGFAAGPSSPADYSSVVAVGGTTLTQDNSARGWSESAWSGGGAGCSQVVAQPSWQQGINTGCANRAEVDVAADADPNTGVAVYDSFQQNGWFVVGGTSASSPMVAAIYALAGNASTLNAAQSLYQNAGQLNDVTAGTDGTCSPTVLCTAGTGWDGPTGNGTPNGLDAF
jgi:subtilase family serine protease